MLFFHLVAMERLGGAGKWDKKLYEDEPDVMLEHPSVMPVSDSGLPEDERAMNGLAERVVESTVQAECCLVLGGAHPPMTRFIN